MRFFPTLTACLLLVFISNCENTDPVDDTLLYDVDDSALSDSLKTIYREQANIIAVRNFFENNSPLQDSVFIPQDSVQMYYFAMVCVFNSESSARDSVFSLYPFYWYPEYNLHEIILAVDSSVHGIDSLKVSGLSGYDDLDNFLIQYALTVKSVSRYTSGYSVLLRSAEAVNTPALCNRISHLDNILWCEPNGYLGDGDRIYARSYSDYLLIDFEQRWGDCPAGCISHHTWHFKVWNSSEVEFLYSSGNKLFEPGSSLGV